MAFKLTYTDGEVADYDDGTAWEVDDGVLKLGREDGDWTVLVSPSHWAVIELVTEKPKADEAGTADAADEDDGDDGDDGDAKDRDD